jgi:hypothetical protein
MLTLIVTCGPVIIAQIDGLCDVLSIMILQFLSFFVVVVTVSRQISFQIILNYCYKLTY